MISKNSGNGIWNKRTARAADKVEIPKAEFVFCGFGFHAPEFGWDDYADVDVKGKSYLRTPNQLGQYSRVLLALFKGVLYL